MVNKQEYNLLQNWTPYNESIVWDITHEYYKNKGISAFGARSDNLIPNDITTNYPNAKAAAQILKASLYKYPVDKKMKVLECGAGSGLFSRNFLYALEELEILDRVELLISDYSVKNLEEINTMDMLSDFVYGEHYRFLYLDVMNPKSVKEVYFRASGMEETQYEMKNVAAVFLNYILDVLPTTVLKHKRNGKFEELFLRVLRPKDDVSSGALNDPFYMDKLIKDTKWIDYNFEDQTAEEMAFKDHLVKYHEDVFSNEWLLYPYGALKACLNMLEICDEDGFILAADIPIEAESFCQVVGNALAHKIDEKFITSYMESFACDSVSAHVNQLVRFMVVKNRSASDPLKDVFNEVYVKNNMVDRYIDLKMALNKFEHRESLDCMKYLLDEFSKIVRHSVYEHIYRGNYHNLAGELADCIEEYKKARKLDFLNDYSLDDTIAHIQMKLT